MYWGEQLDLSQSLEQKFQWKRVLKFGKVIHMILTNGLVTKTVCGHDVTNYTLKANTFGKKCGLCTNIEKQYANSVMAKERFGIDYMPSEFFNSRRYS